MLALAFFNPMLLWALPLAAVPIIIHLLNRRRFNRVPWAAMEYLLRAMKRNRRRMQMEHWIVLLLRTLAVVFLIFLVTRPQLTGGGGVLRARTHHLVMLDDSASMAQRVGAGDIYKVGTAKIHNLVTKLIDSNPGDLFTLLLSSQPDGQPIVPFARVNAELTTKVREALSGRTVGESSLNPGELFAAARKWALERKKDAGDFHYHLVTDSRRQDFVSDGKPQPGVLKHLQEMDAAHAQLTVIAVGPKEVDNLGISAVRRRDRLAMAGSSVTVEVEVTNFGDDNSPATEVSVEIDGTSRVVRPVPPIAPGGRAIVDIQHTFRDPGFHGIVASLPADRYPVDDRGTLALEVVGSSQILVVNGDQGDTPEESETFYLSTALDLGTEVITGIDVTEILPHSFLEYDLSHTNMVWLANVPALQPNEVAKLEKFASEGGGVVLFLGDQVNESDYNQRMFRDGKGILPAAIVRSHSNDDRPDNGFVADRTHFAINDVASVMDVVLSRMVLIKRYFELAEDPNDPVAVPIRVKSRNGHPLMVTKAFGSGIVTLFSTTADLAYCDLCITPAFLPLCQELHKHTTKAHSIAGYNLDSTGTLRLELDSAEYKRDAFVRALGGKGFESTYTAVDPAPAPGAEEGKVISVLTVPMSQVNGLGLFELTINPHRGEPERRLFSRNAPTAEGRLQRLDKAQWLRVYPEDVHDRLEIMDGAETDATVASVGEGEVWRVLALALLTFLLLETFLAWRFGRR